MRHIGESRIYVVPELSTDNEQWINPDFGSPDLRTYYDRKFSGRGQMAQAELSCPYRFRLDEPRNRKEPKAQ